jgi:nucleoid-associated protein YgaU
METISPMRLVLAGAAMAVLAIVTILTIQMLSFRGRYNEAQYTIATMQSDLVLERQDHDSDIAVHEQNLLEARGEISDLRDMLIGLGYDPDYVPDEPTYRPGADPTTTPTPPVPEWPQTHVVVSGDRLSLIAQRFYGNSNNATLEHIRATNNLPNINDIRIGQTLTLTEMN